MVTTSIKFGTDGWRGIIAEDFTFANVRACAQSIAGYLRKSGLAGKGLLIGYDTRFASEDFAAAAAGVIAANGIPVQLDSTASPTPVLSYAITSLKTAGAIIITASHNPPQYNGLKLKTADGTSAPPEITDQLEKELPAILSGDGARSLALPEGMKTGIMKKADTASVYLPHIKKLIDLGPLRQSDLSVIADYMFGAGAGYFREFLGGGRVRLQEINSQRNPIFPGMAQPEPIAKNLNALTEAVVSKKADVGVATDGDADRVGIIDERGNFLDPLQVFSLLTLYLLETQRLKGPIIKTVTGSNMINRLGELYSVPVRETPVGFKYVAPLMINENALIGGEESGGYGFRGHVAERDGILAGLYFLDFMVRTGKSPSQLLAYLYSKVGEHHYLRKDVHFAAADKARVVERVSGFKSGSLAGYKLERIDTKDGLKFIFSGGPWLLVRFSGTEPLIRIYAEAASPQEAEKLTSAGKDLAGV
ncbi:MAG: phosphoglucomutase/phosphomannomutase family protein [Chloroflexi bacterium]|nr:phosphoglucomutase/phosphomannomutase family protein [Chloroflexota bacterium]